jgi:hypothetical protein
VNPHRTTGRTLESLGAEVDELRRTVQTLQPRHASVPVWKALLVSVGVTCVAIMGLGAAEDIRDVGAQVGIGVALALVACFGIVVTVVILVAHGAKLTREL